MRAAALVVAAGASTRFGGGGNKVFVPVAGAPALARLLQTFAALPAIAGGVVVARPGDEARCAQLLPGPGWSVATGAGRRQDSVAQGLQGLPEGTEFVVVHDGARPLVRPALVQRVLEAAALYGAATSGLPVTDTLKVVADGRITRTVDRDGLWAVQTPQAFRRPLLEEAHRRARTAGTVATDDAALVEAIGAEVRVVLGDRDNIKLTLAEDVALATRLAGAGGSYRVGHGYDVHRLVPGRPLIIGGVRLDYHLGLDGHSDADVLLHAVADALLGAAALGDIGQHYPAGDERWRGADSLLLLSGVTALLSEHGFRPVNIDATVVLEAPKLGPHYGRMCRNIAEAAGLDYGAVSVKATTAEGLGPIGAGEGAAAYAVALVAAG